MRAFALLKKLAKGSDKDLARAAAAVLVEHFDDQLESAEHARCVALTFNSSAHHIRDFLAEVRRIQTDVTYATSVSAAVRQLETEGFRIDAAKLLWASKSGQSVWKDALWNEFGPSGIHADLDGRGLWIIDFLRECR